jgi:hypothetical protein
MAKKYGAAAIQNCSKNPRFWHMPALPRFMLPQTPFKTDVVFEGL